MEKRQVQKIIRFVISGTIVAIVGISLLHIFTEWFGLWYLLSSVLSFAVAIIVNFCLQKYWTFENKEGSIHTQGSLFFLVALLNLALNTAFMYSMVDILGVHYIIAQAATMLLLSVMNYFIYQFIIFRPQIETVQDVE